MNHIAHRAEAPLLHGTLTTFRRRCGKASCHCADGEPHESPALVYREGGRSKTLTLSEAEAAWVAAALQRYRQASAELEARAKSGLDALAARRQAAR